MPNVKNRLTNQVVAYDQRQSKLEIAQVDAVHWHKTKNDKNWNVSDIVSRDRRTKAHDPDFSYVRHSVPTIQENGAKFSGTPVNPRRGNAVKALFYKNQKPIILGQVESKFEPPVCRPDPYTIRCKFAQFRPLPRPTIQDYDLDFVQEFPDPKKPQCTNLQHGPCNGDSSDTKEPCLGRDWWTVSDFCQEGDKDPSCEKCVDIDYPKRCKNSWHKKYSRNTMSCQAPNGRDEWKLYNGTYRRAEAETGRSVVYSEGKGHLTEGNASTDQDLRGHWTFQGEKVSGDAGIGSWECSTHTEDVPIGQASQGVRFAGIRPLDMQVLWAWEQMNFPTDSYIRCMKTGDIKLHSLTNASYVDIDGTSETVTVCGANIIDEQASTVIRQTTDLVDQVTQLVHNHGSEQIDGTCTHGACSCSSDIRLKTDISDSNTGLNEVLKLRPVSFRFKRDQSNTHFGLIAQEVKDVLPDVVIGNESNNEYLSINYEGLVPVLIKAIQDLSAQVDELKRVMK